MNQTKANQTGFTLIEVVVVIVITGILLTVALGTGKKITDRARTEETLQEMDRLARAIVGDPNSYSNGIRSEFGYVGDVGSLPPNLDALAANPGSYSTWNGPYISNRFEQTATDYKKDAWQSDYQYTASTSITSIGSGETIARQFAGSTDELLNNRLSGNFYDSDGRPPGIVFKDSIVASLSFPDGIGGLKSVLVTPDMSGYFSIDSIPIGNHDLTVVYLPTNDTLKRFITILPNSNVYEECRLPILTWTSSGGGLAYVAGSAETQTGGCNRVQFDITNTSGSDILLTSMTIAWTGPTAYYKKIKYNGPFVFDQGNPRNGSGDMAVFNSSRVISLGETVTLRIEGFENDPNGGSKVNMGSVDFTIVLSDGSTITFNSGPC